MGVYSISNLRFVNEKYTMETIPNIMYFSSSEKISELKGRVFLSPYIGISSMFLIGKHVLKSLKGYNYNKGYLEWEYPDSKLNTPLDIVHITHNVKEVRTKEEGTSKGYIYKVDISNMKHKLSLFSTNDPNRELIYNGDEPLKILEVINHKLKWVSEYDEENAKYHGYGSKY